MSDSQPHHLATDLVAQLRAEVVVPYKDGYEPMRAPPSKLMTDAADEIEQLRAERKELARLLNYAAKHSSAAPLMNDAWREDALAAVEKARG